ncbi:hypothetical protein Efla_007204 [Eimeria flavescens]
MWRLVPPASKAETRLPSCLAAVVAIAGAAFLVLRCYAGSLRIATRARHSERRLASGEGGEGPWPFGGSGELEGSCEEPDEQQPPRPAQGGCHQPLPPATAGPEDNTSGAARRPGTRPTHGKDMAKMPRLYREEGFRAAHVRHDHPYARPSSSDESTPPSSPQPAPTSAQGERDVNQSETPHAKGRAWKLEIDLRGTPARICVRCQRADGSSNPLSRLSSRGRRVRINLFGIVSWTCRWGLVAGRPRWMKGLLILRVAGSPEPLMDVVAYEVESFHTMTASMRMYPAIVRILHSAEGYRGSGNRGLAASWDFNPTPVGLG